MVDYKQILRLRAEGVSQRGIADALGCSRNTIAAVFAAANAAGIGFGVADYEQPGTFGQGGDVLGQLVSCFYPVSGWLGVAPLPGGGFGSSVDEDDCLEDGGDAIGDVDEFRSVGEVAFEDDGVEIHDVFPFFVLALAG